MKKLLFASALVLLVSAIFAFDWPQNEIQSDSFFSYFSQLRGGTIGTSLVFSESDEVKSADAGRVLTVITEHGDDEIFESTLGNALILSHKDQLLTVYANLDEEKLNDFYEMRDISAGTPFGHTGLSGWQEGEGCLEFQVLDIKQNNYINPRILMPRVGKELPLSLKNLTAVNRKGTVYDLSSQKSLSSGVYYLYKDRQDIAMPYKTTVYINGAVAESLTYDTLSESNGKISVKGKKNYPVEIIYPDSGRQFLGEITLTKGKNQVSIVSADILGKEIQITYNIEVR